MYIDDISLPNIKIEQLYIKWNEKLDLSVKEAFIVTKSTNKNPALDFKSIDKSLKKALIFHNWFEHIVVDKIVFNDISATFNYKDGGKGFLVASSPNFSFKSSLDFENEFFNLKIDDFKDFKRKIKVSGNIVLDKFHSELVTSLDVNINDDVHLNLLGYSNNEKLFYKIKSLKNIKDITHTMKLLHLHEDVKYWAYEAINMSYVTINSAYGWLEYKNIDDAYKNVYVSATGHKLSYKYNPKLEPVYSQNTELEYKKGVLYIKPQRAYSYNFYLNKSWLKIDFTKKEELLTLYLLFDSKLNYEMLNILNTYKIKVPFLQNSGSVKTNLKLAVNLRTIAVDAKGEFFTKKASFNYQGVDIDVKDLYVLLDNYDVQINNMYAKYKDIANTTADVKYNAKSGKGIIDFKVKDVDFKNVEMPLHNTQPFNIKYTLSPAQDNIKIENTSWLYKDKIVNVDKLDIPFDLKKLVVNIPATLVEIPRVASAYVSGTSDIRTNISNLNIDLLTFKYGGLELSQSNTPIKLKYDKKLSIESESKIQFVFNNLDCTLEKTLIDATAYSLNLKHSVLNINDIVKAKIAGTYNLESNNGDLESKSLVLGNKKLGDLFSSDEKIDFNISNKGERFSVSSSKLDMIYKESKGQWSVNIESLKNISQNSKLLQDYNVTSGKLHIEESNDGKSINFLANIKYPYKILVINNKPVQDYVIEGRVNKKTNKVIFSINDAINVNVNKDIRVRVKNSGINLSAAFNLMKNIHLDPEGDVDQNIILKANNSYFYISKNRHIIFDYATLQYFNKIITAQFIHDQGKAGLKFENDKFHIYGENFNDKFMDNLFALSKFKGGSFEFSMDGTTSEYDGIFHVKDTTVLDYKVLNNVLAFVNTIPSLITFSIPGYDSNGLKVSNAYMNFHAKDNVFDISDIYLDSQEINILGRGTADYNTNSINVLLNLKTDLGSTMSKVPLVGYILLDGNTISTTLSITGALDNPDVKTLLARDIVVAPLNIVKRVLTLPYHLLSNDNNTTTDETVDEGAEDEQ